MERVAETMIVRHEGQYTIRAVLHGGRRINRRTGIQVLAAQSFVPKSWRSPEGTIHNNVAAQLNILESLRSFGMYSAAMIITGLDPETVNLVLIGKKILRLRNMYRAGLDTANGESLRDAIRDMIGGCVLLLVLMDGTE